MNLKESFRYQKFIERMLQSACNTMSNRDHCLKFTKYHLRHDVNPDAEDFTETVEVDEFTPNDTVLAFMMFMVEEKEKLSIAIGKAKASLDFDLDAAVETNKARQFVNSAIKGMFRHIPSRQRGQEFGYKFDVNGAQQRYYYNVETIAEENYDKAAAKDKSRALVTEADKVSAAIDAALINTAVEYEPPYDVNESFNDVIEAFAGDYTPAQE